MGKATEISAAQAVQGMRAALRNAEALLEEARILSDAGHGARAAALAILAHEELGKIPPLANADYHAKAGNMGNWWKGFRSHTQKIAMQDLLALCMIFDSADSSHIERVVVGDTAEHLNRIKMRALYTDFEDGSFICPLDNEDVVERKDALINYVDTLLQVHRAVAGRVTPEYLAQFWSDPARQRKIDEDTQMFHRDVVSRWASKRFAPPPNPVDSL